MGGADGILLQPNDQYEWLNSAAADEVEGYDCTALKHGKKALWSSAAGGNATHIVWTLSPDIVASNAGETAFWFD